MASDVPAFLEVGTPVSAKFKGAFCEANIKSVKKHVKIKVQFKDGSGPAIVNNELIEGELKLNTLVQVKVDFEWKEAAIQKMNDHSLYTVVFDDGDERTLRRTNVCVMGERHFNEHENLDNLPLTDPENFLTPVLLSAEKRRKRRRSQPNLDEEDSDSDGPKPRKKYSDYDKEFLGKVVCVEQGERKKSWFPALGLRKHANQPVDNQVYVQSFKDGKKMLVKKEDVKEFCKDKEPLVHIFKGETKVEPVLRSAIDKAVAYHDLGELPKGWNILDTIDEKDESSDDDNTAPLNPVLSADAKAFQENIYSFMKKEGNPIVKPPTINNQGVDLHRLYELVLEKGGMEEVSNQQWRHIYTQLGLRNIHTTASYNMKTLYRRYLFPYEEHLRNTVKSSPSRQAKTKSKRNTPFKDDMDKLSTISESDSEPDRRRSTRSNRAVLEKSFEEFEKRKRPVPEQHDDKSTYLSKDLIADHEIDIKSETEDVDVVNSPQTSESSEDDRAHDNERSLIGKYKIGARIAVRYGTGKNQRIYNAKILEVDKDDNDGTVLYYIHYNGWNHRHDEWIKDDRIHGLSSGSTPKGKKNTGPPTSIFKIAKDPPLKYKAKLEADINTLIPIKRTTIASENLTSKPPTKLPVTYIQEKPPSPIKSPPLLTTTAIVEHPFLTDLKPAVHIKKTHHPKPVNDALFIPDIKPSPIKPRMTRNSMQDTFLLNALEESIGKPTQTAMTLQQDVLLKSEPPQIRRRSIRQQNPSPKSEHIDSDESSKDEIEETTTNKPEKQDPVTIATDQEVFEHVDKKPLPLEPKESSKEDTVKKWIEDSSNVMSTSHKSVDDVNKLDNFERKPSADANFGDSKSTIKRGRKAKTKTVENRKNKADESDSEAEMKADGIEDTKENNHSQEVVSSNSNNDNNNLQTEKDRTSETAHTLSDLCNIVENIPKLQAAASIDEHTDSSKRQSSPTKDTDRNRKKRDNRKRRRTQSITEEEGMKSPREKKEKRMSPPLDYNVDFMSDLSDTLYDKDSVERIVIMQSRLNEMRKLYYKLRTEVASIDRKRRRKLRKQLENKLKSNL